MPGHFLPQSKPPDQTMLLQPLVLARPHDLHLLLSKTFSIMPMKIFSLLLALMTATIFLCIGQVANIHAADSAEPETWRLYADKTTTSHDHKYVEAFGNVILDHGQDYIKADYARYYQATRWVYLKGNISAKFQGDFLQAEEAEFDLNTHVGWLKNGQVFMDDPHMYFSGELLKKTGPETYEFREATVTVCDGERPAWSIKTSRGDITIDGYAHLWSPRFQILDQPLLFSPYAVIPVKTKRQSGFLMPEFGTSDRLGTYYNQPYYQVIDEKQDVTLYANAMGSKGLMLGLEYRHTPNIYSKGLWQVDYLRDTSTEHSSLYRDNKGMKRTNTERWWLRGKYDGYLLHPDWNVKVDLDLASDQDYLREFSRGYTGFDKSRQNFVHYFGRDIADSDDKLRSNRILLSRNWAHVGFQGLIDYTQNLRYTNNKTPGMTRSQDPTIQRLPELNLNLYQFDLPGTPFTLEGTSQLVSFWREYGTTGTRLDIHPVLGLPLHFDYGSIIPKIGWRGTSYLIQRFENDKAGVNTSNTSPQRSLPDFSATAYSEFSRVFTINDDTAMTANQTSPTWLKLRHTIQPLLEYSYIPYESQDKLPYFDDLDRIQADNELKYSINNIFTRKTGQLRPDSTRPGELSPDFNYAELIRLRFKQGYDLREASRRDDLEKYARRPFSDILLDLTTRLSPWLSLRNKSWYSPYENKITEHEHALYLHNSKSIYGSFGLDFLEKIDEYKRPHQQRQRIARFGAGFSPWKGISADFLYRVDYEDKIDLEKRLTLLYTHQCFSIETYWSETDTDTRFGILLNLAQLGAVGGH